VTAPGISPEGKTSDSHASEEEARQDLHASAPGGPGHPGTAGRPGAGSARREHHGVRQAVQRRDGVHARRHRSFQFILKTPPAAQLLIKAAGVQKGSGTPQSAKVGAISREQLREIAQKKMADLNANDIEAAEKIISGTARSMGITIKD
jgi:ribosomal protein L11